MKISMYDASRKTACKEERGFPIKLNDGKSYNYDKSVACYKVLKDLKAEKIKEEDVPDGIREAYKDVPCYSKEQQEIECDDLSAQILRYTRSEKHAFKTAITKDIALNSDLTVTCSPDYIYIDRTPINIEGDKVYDGVVEIIKVKMGKNHQTQKETDNDLCLKAMLLYGEEVAPKTGKYIVKATYHYMRREDDKWGEKPNFDPDYFAPGGNNIVSIAADVENGSLPEGVIENIDKLAGDYFNGKEREECTEKDCEYCVLKNICHYSEPPAQIKIEKAATTLSSIRLTKSQEEAINYRKGIVRINAGAGSGKTTVVALRVASMIAEGTDPAKIFLTTFTNSGAEEMRDRIAKYLEDFGLDDVDISDMHIMTFNAFGNEVIKKEYARLGFPQIPKVIDDVERSAIISHLLNNNIVPGLNYRHFQMDSKYVKGALAMGKKVFDIMKKNQYSSYDVSLIRDELGWDKRFITNEALEGLTNLYDLYDEEMKNSSLIEFSDQEVLLMQLLLDDPYYLEQFGFEHIIVDEFQDSNENQIKFLQLLTETPAFVSLMVVGDDNQAIFSFRGSTPEYIINFQNYFKDVTIDDICLSENQRSQQNIIDFANDIAELNHIRVIKELTPTRPVGKPVIVRGFIDKKEENQYILSEIKAKIEEGISPESIAYIAPTNSKLIEMAGLLNEAGIPSVMMNPEPYLKNSRVLAAIGFFKFFNDYENTVAAAEFINAELKGGISFFSEEEIMAKIEDLIGRIEDIKAMPETERMKGIEKVLRSIDCDDEIFESFIDQILLKPYNMLIQYIYDFEEFGEKVAKRREHSYPGVVLTTAHSSKGLEWPICFNSITGYDSEELHTAKKDDSREEKRRLLFVSCTRARDELYVTGVYTAYGSEKAGYTYDQFLKECYDISGQKFDSATIENERKMKKAEAKARKKAEAEAEAAKELAAEKPKAVEKEEKTEGSKKSA